MQWADLQRIIAEEVAAALARGRTRTCECHAVLYDCCPDRVRGVIDAGASRLGLYAGEKVPSDVAALIDHTLLKADATRQEIKTLQGSARIRFRDGVYKPDVGVALREAASRQLDWRVHRSRISPRCDDDRREAV